MRPVLIILLLCLPHVGYGQSSIPSSLPSVNPPGCNVNNPGTCTTWTPAQWQTFMNYLSTKVDTANGVVTNLNINPSVTLSGSQSGIATTSGLFSQGAWFGSTTTANMFLNQLSASDVFSSPNALVETFWVNLSVGASSAAPQFTAIGANVNQTAASGSKAAGAAQALYVPFQSQATVSHNEGGTGTALGQAYGGLIGLDSNMALSTGATNFYDLEGIEIGVTTASGSSVSHRAGVEIFSNAVVQGTLTDAGIDIASSGGSDLGFKCGLCFGKADTTAWPVSPTGTMIGTFQISSGTQAAAYGMDLSQIAFSSGFLKSIGFLVDGSGNITAASYKAGASAGVSCSGTPTSSFASVNGIVTHC